MAIQPGQLATRSLTNSSRGQDICQVLAAAINSADAGAAVRNAVVLHGNRLSVYDRSYDLLEFERILLVGAGKAAAPMLTALCALLKGRISAGFAITKRGHLGPLPPCDEPRISIVEAGHPVPDPSNLQASRRLVSLLQGLTARDLVICLISGGGSALLTLPADGITLADLQHTTRLLLASGADIGEMNLVRKHLDDIKGGGLARLIYPAIVISLVISDVVGDHLDRIASGPTAADPSTFADAWAVLGKYHLTGQIPNPVLLHLQAGMSGVRPETLKAGDRILDNVFNAIIANNRQAIQAAKRAARQLGFTTHLLTTCLHGEACESGKTLVDTVKSRLACSPPLSLPACFIAGGETTVTLHGTGMGGRNQELACGAVDGLSGDAPLLLASLATDGGDGPTDAAGAVATNQTKTFGLSLGVEPADFLANNDTYHYFEPLGDLLKTGPTLTNVNDLVLVFAL